MTVSISSNHFWDSCVLIRYLTAQPNELVDDIGRFLDEAIAGRRRIFMSTMVIAEIKPFQLQQRNYQNFQELMDAIQAAFAVAKSATAMLEFAKALREAIKKLRTKSKASLEDREAQVLKTVEEICKAAVKSKSQVEIKHKAKTGDSLEIRISPVEALEIREAAKQERAALRRLEKDGANPRLTSQQPLQLADRLAEAYGKGGLTSDVRSLIEAIVTALRDGGYADALETVAVDLANRGMDDLAAFVRAEANKPRDLEPPIASG